MQSGGQVAIRYQAFMRLIVDSWQSLKKLETAIWSSAFMRLMDYSYGQFTEAELARQT